METTETTYDVRVVGPIWQPGFTCASHVTVKGDDLAELPRADDETDADYEVRMVQATADTQLGDFSAVTAWDIRRIVSRRTFQHVASRKDGMLSLDYVETSTRHDTVTTLVAFDEGAETAWMDAHAEYAE